MDHGVEILVRYGYALLIATVFAEQIGVPVPAAPMLVAAGALVGSGRFSLALVLALSTLAAVVADAIWYELGRRKGTRILELLCRISLEPDSCVRRTEDVFARHGAKSLLVAKFVPGLSTVAPPLAGIFRMRWSRFLAFNTAGTAIWAGTFVGLGWLFADQLEAAFGYVPHLGWRSVAVVVAALAIWIAVKYVRRQLFIRALRIDRITPQELKTKIDAGENVTVVDLRSSVDFEADPMTLPGALRVAAADLDAMKQTLANAGEVVLYCT
jgi:membrane protein DedA with SNARE-associated domain